MPKLDLDAAPAVTGTGYPKPYDEAVRGRSKRRVGDLAGLTQFGVNLTTLASGAASAHRHWHESEDEFVFVLEGEVVLEEDDGETVLRAGDAAGFKAGVPNGHRLVNRSDRKALLLEVGTRAAADAVTYTDPAIDMRVSKSPGEGWRSRSGTAARPIETKARAETCRLSRSRLVPQPSKAARL
ncbi:cupin domain-containing protein [Parvularcula dongshanensis]|uniref:Putative cupin superfamily protein n=1 Tax=Parvularcula dongshanensis TaxID=1173995 RepID=A0A840I5Y1_9PROT|nr:cupin domain-containing protein [Parvularcula dongshanensis]MBB4659725.1 putative cupin superfamily protein [Parvularcula dongshanensis]